MKKLISTLVRIQEALGTLLLAIFFCLPQPRRFYEKHRGSLLVQLPLFLLFWVCVYFIATSSGNAFLYSRF